MNFEMCLEKIVKIEVKKEEIESEYEDPCELREVKLQIKEEHSDIIVHTGLILGDDDGQGKKINPNNIDPEINSNRVLHQNKKHKLDFPVFVKKTTYKSHQCEKDGVQNSDVMNHLSTPTGKKPFLCKQCNKTFASYSNLSRHIATHSEEKTKPVRLCEYDYMLYICKLCDKRFASNPDLSRHIVTHSGGKIHEVALCEKDLENNSNLTMPIRMHSEEKPHECAECDKAFKHNFDLKRHMKISHSGEKPYKCVQCDKDFPIRAYLYKHMAMHHGEKPHICNQCGKGFPFISGLKKHMVVHTEERPHICTRCGMSFLTTSNLKSHMKSHSEEMPYKCARCGKAYSSSSGLRMHMTTHIRRHSELLVKARSNTLALNIEKRLRNESTECELCHTGEEDLKHFLLECPTLEEERDQVLMKKCWRDKKDEMINELLYNNEEIERVKTMLENMWQKRKLELELIKCRAIAHPPNGNGQDGIQSQSET